MMRRSLLRGLAATVYGGLPPRRPDQEYPSTGAGVAPGTHAGNLRARSLVLSGTGDGVGLFEYSGAPGPGNPPIAYAAPPGVQHDPYGNVLPATSGGFTVPNNALGFYAQLLAGVLLFNTPGSVVSAGSVGLNGSTNLMLESPVQNAGGHTAMLELLSESTISQVLIADFPQGGVPPTPSTTAQLEVQGAIQTTALNPVIANGSVQSQLGDFLASAGNVNITAAGKGVVRTGEVWHTPTLAAGFSAGSPAPRFQLEAVGAGRVRLAGVVNLTATEAAGATMFTLPANYLPAVFHSFVTSNSLSGYTLGARAVQVNTSGQVQLGSSGVNTNFVVLDGICFELD